MERAARLVPALPGGGLPPVPEPALALSDAAGRTLAAGGLAARAEQSPLFPWSGVHEGHDDQPCRAGPGGCPDQRCGHGLAGAPLRRAGRPFRGAHPGGDSPRHRPGGVPGRRARPGSRRRAWRDGGAVTGSTPPPCAGLIPDPAAPAAGTGSPGARKRAGARGERAVRRGTGVVTRHRRGWAAAAILAVAALAAGGGCSHPAARLPAPDGPPARPGLRRPGAGPGRDPAAACLRRARDARRRASTAPAPPSPSSSPTPTPGPPPTWPCTPAATTCPRPAEGHRYGHRPAAATRGAPAHWAREGTEDVEMIHALAPDAALVYLQIHGADPG